METLIQNQREIITDTNLLQNSISKIELGKKAEEITQDIAEGKKESIESVKFSAETTLKDAKLKETLGRLLGGLLGVFLLFGAITNVFKDLKEKKKSPWIFSRIIMDFTASGALIGYAAGYTLQGISIGVLMGVLTLIFEVIYSNK